jgi:hypothetical protein
MFGTIGLIIIAILIILCKVLAFIIPIIPIIFNGILIILGLRLLLSLIPE